MERILIHTIIVSARRGKRCHFRYFTNRTFLLFAKKNLIVKGCNLHKFFYEIINSYEKRTERSLFLF